MAQKKQHETWAELTDRPDLYKNVYWGMLTTKIGHPGIDVIAARNHFVSEYKVVAQIPVPDEVVNELGEYGTTAFTRFLDHQECYENDDELIFIASPYLKHDDSGLFEFCEKAEFEPVAGMYIEGETTTIMRKFAKSDAHDQSKMSEECPVQYWAELTEYPELYMRTYWGHFTTDLKTQPGQSVIDARNVKDRGIIGKSRWTKEIDREIQPLRQMSRFKIMILDHLECYESNDRIILIASPYKESADADLISFCRRHDFSIIPNMYIDGSSTTIMKSYPKPGCEGQPGKCLIH